MSGQDSPDQENRSREASTWSRSHEGWFDAARLPSEIRVMEAEHAALIEIHGQMDGAACAYLRDHITSLAELGVREVIVDLDQVAYLDSTALVALISAQKRLAEHGGRLSLGLSHPQLLRILEITGLHEVFDIIPRRGVDL